MTFLLCVYYLLLFLECRAIRQKYLNQLKSAKVPEDVGKELKDQIQQGTDRANAQIEVAVKEKVEEINQV